LRSVLFVDVLVVGGNDNLGISAAGRRRVGSNQVIRLVSPEPDIVHAQGFHRFLNDRELPREIFRSFVALLLVRRQKHHPPFRQAGIPDYRGRVGFDLGQHLAQGLDETEDRIGRFAPRIGQVANGEK
jgi:hypothetical protein